MHGARWTVCGARCTVYGVQCTVHGVRSEVDGLRCTMCGARYTVYGARRMVYDVWCTVCGTRCTVCGARCAVYGARCTVYGKLHEALCSESRVDASACIAFRIRFLARSRAACIHHCGTSGHIPNQFQPRNISFPPACAMGGEIEAQIGFRFWFRGTRKSGSRVITQIQMLEPFLGTSKINLFSKNWFQAFVWRSYINHTFWEPVFGTAS